jgi:hypothetical protein
MPVRQAGGRPQEWMLMTNSGTQARWLEAARLVAAGHRQGLRCPENQDGDLDVTWGAFPDQTGGEYWLRCPACGARNELLTHDPKSGPELPEPWFRPESRVRAALVAEALAEIAADHELAGHELTAVVTCAGCDEVIFRVDDGTFALVHLTWAHHPEPQPWPAIQRLDGFLARQAAIDNHQH